MDVKLTLTSGILILDEVLLPHGFVFRDGPSGQSSGGDFASGYYFRSQRKLEVHLRHNLGLVTYHIGSIALDHPSYMRALLGPAGGNRFPGYSGDLSNEFENLRDDLNEFCADFLTGDGDEFRRCWEMSKRLNPKWGMGI